MMIYSLSSALASLFLGLQLEYYFRIYQPISTFLNEYGIWILAVVTGSMFVVVMVLVLPIALRRDNNG